MSEVWNKTSPRLTVTFLVEEPDGTQQEYKLTDYISHVYYAIYGRKVPQNVYWFYAHRMLQYLQRKHLGLSPIE